MNQSDTQTGANPISVYGFAEEATAFNRRHPLWKERLPRLAHAINVAFTRTQTMSTPEEKFVYFYGNLVAEDFMEIFLMATNGYGIGAMKLLRSMYEHTVTLRYLHDHPDEVQTFIQYSRVQEYKLMKPIIDMIGSGALSPSIVADVETRYAEVKDKFLIKTCNSKTCNSKRVNHTWSKLDFVSMAKTTGDIGTLIVPGYFLPLRHAHSTFAAITGRLEKTDGRLGFQREPQPKLADEALMMAHNCVLVALQVQDERFKIQGLQAEIQNCVGDWAEIWAPDLITPHPQEASQTELEEATRRRAYQLYESRGREDGHDLDDWLQAEAELTANQTRTVAA